MIYLFSDLRQPRPSALQYPLDTVFVPCGPFPSCLPNLNLSHGQFPSESSPSPPTIPRRHPLRRYRRYAVFRPTLLRSNHLFHPNPTPVFGSTMPTPGSDQPPRTPSLDRLGRIWNHRSSDPHPTRIQERDRYLHQRSRPIGICVTPAVLRRPRYRACDASPPSTMKPA